MDSAMESRTKLVGLLSLVQGSSLPFILNFDPKFKNPKNMGLAYPHGHLESYGSMVYRTFVAFVGSCVWYR